MGTTTLDEQLTKYLTDAHSIAKTSETLDNEDHAKSFADRFPEKENLASSIC